MALSDRIKKAWNAFTNDPEAQLPLMDYGGTYTYRPDRKRHYTMNEGSIIESILTRMSVDVSAAQIRHARLDENERFQDEIDSGLNNCLKVAPNIDQEPRQLRRDIAITLFDKGVAALVPVETTVDPSTSGSFDILNMRVGEVLEWFPQHVRVRLYDERDGQSKDIIVPKATTPIIENPFYSVMNQPNSTLQRLIQKLRMLDAVDEQTSSGRLDILIQLPYAVRSEARRQAAKERIQDIEFQLKGSQYGIGYVDATEKITQLNRPAENNLLKQVELLTGMLYSQLGLTEEIMNGTADEKAMLNYNNRTIAPVLDAIVEAMRRTFLTKTARSQKQSIVYFRDPFALVPLEDIAEIADKFTRNEIVSSNEIRSFVGLKPSPDPKADELRNSNMPQPEEEVQTDPPKTADPAVDKSKEGDSPDEA